MSLLGKPIRKKRATPGIDSFKGSKPSKNPCAGWLWGVTGWVALHGSWVNGVDAYKEDDRPQDCKDGSYGVGLDAVNECHFLCLSPMTRANK